MRLSAPDSPHLWYRSGPRGTYRNRQLPDILDGPNFYVRIEELNGCNVGNFQMHQNSPAAFQTAASNSSKACLHAPTVTCLVSSVARRPPTFRTWALMSSDFFPFAVSALTLVVNPVISSFVGVGSRASTNASAAGFSSTASGAGPVGISASVIPPSDEMSRPLTGLSFGFGPRFFLGAGIQRRWLNRTSFFSFFYFLLIDHSCLPSQFFNDRRILQDFNYRFNCFFLCKLR